MDSTTRSVTLSGLHPGPDAGPVTTNPGMTGQDAGQAGDRPGDAPDAGAGSDAAQDGPLQGSITPDTAALAAAVRRLARTSVMVVGDVMLDRYVYGHVNRISPEAPIAVITVEREVAVPGGAGNVVRNLTALGAAVAFISVVGDDQAGSDLTGLIGGQPGVEPWLLVQGARATTVKTRYVSQGQQLLRSDREETGAIHVKIAERLMRIARDALAATSVAVLSDYDKGVLAADIPAQIIAAARAAGRRVVVDPKGVDYARYAGADVVTPWAQPEVLTRTTSTSSITMLWVARAKKGSARRGSFLKTGKSLRRVVRTSYSANSPYVLSGL